MAKGSKRWGLALAIAGVLVAGTAEARYEIPGKVYRVSVDAAHPVQALADRGLDILEVEGDHAYLYMDAGEAARLRGIGYRVRIEIDDLAAAIDAIESSPVATDAQYHTYDSLNADLRALEASGIAKVSVVGRSLEGRDVLGVKISDNPQLDEPGEKEGVIVGCHHAREWISVEVPFLLAKAMVDEYATNPAVKALVDGGVTWIVPMVNPDGFEYSRLVNRMWRKNRRLNSGGSYGVDLNRNYASGWGGSGSSGTPSSDTYRGTAPFSEPETQVIRDFVGAHDFQFLLTYHSYSQLVLWPWGWTYDKAPDDALLGRIANDLESMINSVHGVIYTAEKSSDLYLAAGTTDDWFYEVTGRPGFTIELRPNSSIPGFTLPPDQIIPTYEENRPAAFHLIAGTQADGDSDGKVDLVDNCAAAYNPDQADGDGDGLGDVCDAYPDDRDNDGVDDAVDNCVDVANPDQADADHDGIGDACDTGGGCARVSSQASGEAPFVPLAAALAFALRGRSRRRSGRLTMERASSARAV
ncbi:MAG: M14 family metallopeptidase [bacterium]